MTYGNERTSGLRRLEPQLSGPSVTVDHGGAYEALLGLMMFAGHQPPGEYDVGADWFERARAAASPELVRDVTRLSAGVPTVFGHLLGLAHQADNPRDTHALIDLITALPEGHLRLSLLGYSSSTVRRAVPDLVLLRAAEGDKQAIAELLASSAVDECWSVNIRALLEIGAQEARELTVQVLRRWHDEVFAEQEAELTPVLADQADRWRRDAARLGGTEVVERATNGLVFGADLPQETVVLVPSVLGSPWVYTCDHNAVKIVCCPVSRPGPDADGPTLAAVFRALGDEVRLRILRDVARSGGATLAELTRGLGLSKSTVHQHVLVLRNAGVLRVTVGRDRRYTLRGGVPLLDELLSTYLSRP